MIGRPPTIAPIVEGKGEEEALGVLLRAVAAQLGVYVEVAKPFRLDSGKMRKPEELAKAVRFQAARVNGAGGVLVLRDGDDKDVGCILELAGELAAVQASVESRVEIVIAAPEFEAWFLASVESLTRHRAIRDDAGPVLDPEAKRDAKKRLQAIMTESYRETRHQSQLSALIDVEVARGRSRSFRRLVHAVQLLAGIGT